MSNAAIKLKKSSVVGKAPIAGDIDYGEVAINYADGRLYYKDASNNIKNFIDSDLIDTRISLLAPGLDSNQIINFVDSDYVQNRSNIIGSANQVILDNFAGDSSTTSFVLTNAPTTEQHAIVAINGVIQHTSAYTLSGNTLILSEAPGLDDSVEVRTLRMQNGSVELRDYKQYIYQPSSPTTVFSGVDVNGATLAYDAGKVEVYYNGIQLVPGLDFTANTDTSVTLLSTPADSGDTVVITSLSKASFLEKEVVQGSAALTTVDSDQVVDTFTAATYRSAKYLIQMTQNSRYHATEVLLVHDGVNVYTTQYADIFTESDLGTIDADISAGAVRLLVTPNYANTTVRTKRIDLGV